MARTWAIQGDSVSTSIIHLYSKPAASQMGHRAIASHRAETGIIGVATSTTTTLEPPCPEQRCLTSPSSKPDLECYYYQSTQHRHSSPQVATVDASTMTNSIQMHEASSPEERQSCPQTSHASTQMVPPPVITTNETSPKTDRTPSLQTRHASMQTPQPPVVMERCTQTDTVPHPRTMQAAT